MKGRVLSKYSVRDRTELHTRFEEALSSEAATTSVGGGYFVDEHVCVKHVCRRRRGKE